MNAALAVTLALLSQLPARATVPFPEPVAVEVWVSEDWPADSLEKLARMPGVSVGLRTRSNMLRADAAKAVARGGLVELTPTVGPAHVDQFRRMQGTRLVIELPQAPPDDLRARLGRLGRQPLRVVLERLDPARAAWLAGLKNAEIELDLSGRIPEQEELTLLLGLDRVRRVLRLRASDPPELLSLLARMAWVRVVVEAESDRVSAQMLAALGAQPAPVRVRVGRQASAADLLQFAHLPGISFETELGSNAAQELSRLEQLLREVTLDPTTDEGSVEKSARSVDSRLDRSGEPK